MKTDTIAAIATAVSNSGIGIIRVSGEEAIDLIHSIFINNKKEHCLNRYKSHTIHYGFIANKEDEILDEVMISVMKAPNSYTMEDTVEINCHGGVFIMQKILELIINSGARIAEPGEFTKRAFLHGRIDLTKAEAVMDLIESRNEFAAKSAVSQLKGSVSEVIKELRTQILQEIAFIEAALDDPEHFDLEAEGYDEVLFHEIKEIEKRIQSLIDSAGD